MNIPFNMNIKIRKSPLHLWRHLSSQNLSQFPIMEGNISRNRGRTSSLMKINLKITKLLILRAFSKCNKAPSQSMTIWKDSWRYLTYPMIMEERIQTKTTTIGETLTWLKSWRHKLLSAVMLSNKLTNKMKKTIFKQSSQFRRIV